MDPKIFLAMVLLATSLQGEELQSYPNESLITNTPEEIGATREARNTNPYRRAFKARSGASGNYESSFFHHLAALIVNIKNVFGQLNQGEENGEKDEKMVENTERDMDTEGPTDTTLEEGTGDHVKMVTTICETKHGIKNGHGEPKSKAQLWLAFLGLVIVLSTIIGFSMAAGQYVLGNHRADQQAKN